jgi:cysteine desulfurase
MTKVLQEDFGNPSSSHSFGRQAKSVLEFSRKAIAKSLNAASQEIIFTSGGTESNNWILRNAVTVLKVERIISSKIEHHAVLHVLEALKDEFDIAVYYVDILSNGEIDVTNLVSLLSDTKRTLVSLMHVNNEIGVIQPIDEIGELCRSKGIIFHSDAAQATGKTPIDLEKTKVDLVTFTAHKSYGPKGVGALYVRRKPRVRLEAQMHGGGHERGLRSGTLATHQIVGMGEAFRLAKEEMDTEIVRIRALRDRLAKGLIEMEEVYVNGDMDHRVPHNLNVSFNYVEGESLIMAIKDIAVSSGSACTSASLEPSYVLRALGRSDELAHSSIRFTFGRFTTNEDVDFTIDLIKKKVEKLRELSPLWDMHKEGIDISKIQWAAH